MEKNIQLIVIAIIVAGALVGTGLYFGLSGQATEVIDDTDNNTNTSTSLNPTTITLAELKDDDASTGPGSILMVEFSDYACGYCARHHSQTVPVLKANYIDTGKLELIHRNFVLSAQKEAEAVECADDQGKYWEYHDYLFWNRGNTDEEFLKDLASDLELDTTQFNACLESGEKIPELENDMDVGRGLGITGTPSFIIAGQRDNVDENDLNTLLQLDFSLEEYYNVFENTQEGTIVVRIIGAQPYETFQTTIDALL